MTPGDFRVPGVSSISADLHKFGYTARGASTILWRDEHLRGYQWFEFDDWPAGSYRTPGVAGTRPPGAIAAAWAVLQYLGAAGYRAAVDRTMRLARKLQDGVNSIRDLQVFGKPAMWVFSYGSSSLDIYAVADGMEARGWSISRGRDPSSIHVMVFNTPAVESSAEAYLADLEQVAENVRRGGLQGEYREARYG